MNRCLVFLCLLSFVPSLRAELLISQYYEGTSNNKWIELKNTGTTSINLSSYSLGLWTNANAEGYKTSVAPSQFLTMSGTLAGGGVYLLRNASATLPAYATADVSNSSVINFNGNDSIALYNAGTFSSANLVDAIGFTNAGNQGVDRSFVRISTDPGFNLTAGSNVTDFSTIWQQFTLAAVDNALAGTEERLGFSSLQASAVPEPSTLILAGIGSLGFVGWRRRNKLKA